MATWVNETKNSTTFSPTLKDGDAYWGDEIFTWGDADVYWAGTTTTSWTNGTKASTSFTNETKH